MLSFHDDLHSLPWRYCATMSLTLRELKAESLHSLPWRYCATMSLTLRELKAGSTSWSRLTLYCHPGEGRDPAQ